MANFETYEAVDNATDSAKQGFLENIPEYAFAMRKIEKKGKYIDKLLEDSVNIYSYIAKEFNVNTLTEARKYISKGKIDDKIIKLWIDEGMFGVDMYLSNAVFKGYPQYKEELTKKIKEAQKILRLEKEEETKEEAEEREEELKLTQ